MSLDDLYDKALQFFDNEFVQLPDDLIKNYDECPAFKDFEKDSKMMIAVKVLMVNSYIAGKKGAENDNT